MPKVVAILLLASGLLGCPGPAPLPRRPGPSSWTAVAAARARRSARPLERAAPDPVTAAWLLRSAQARLGQPFEGNSDDLLRLLLCQGGQQAAAPAPPAAASPDQAARTPAAAVDADQAAGTPAPAASPGHAASSPEPATSFDLDGLYRASSRARLLHTDLPVMPGEIVFFRDTWDRNRNREVDDPLTAVGIVEYVSDDDLVTFIHPSRGQVQRGVLSLAAPGARRSADGRLQNSYLRTPRRGDLRFTEYLAGQLWVGFSGLPPSFRCQPEGGAAGPRPQRRGTSSQPAAGSRQR